MATDTGLLFNILAAVTFYVAFAVFLYIRRKKVEVQGKVMFLYRTERFNKLMKRIADLSPRFWKSFGLLAIPVGFIAMSTVLALLLAQSWKILTTPGIGPQAQLLLPGPTTQSVGPIQFISVWIFLFAVLVIFIVHEGMHGVVANAWKLKVKNSGIGLLAIIPLAFVEPDEKQLQKQPVKVQLSVFGAGALANFITAIALILLTTLAIIPAAAGMVDQLPGVKIESVVAGFPAEQSGLRAGDIIVKANGVSVSETQDLINILTAAKPDDTIVLETSEKRFEMQSIENPKDKAKAYVGINFRQNFEYDQTLIGKYGEKFVSGVYGVAQSIIGLFNITAVLNVLIGAINLLPLGPIDGGRMADLALRTLVKNQNRAKKAFAFLTYLSLGLLLFNILGPYFWRLF